MRRFSLCTAALLLVASPALAQGEPGERVAFGHDVIVHAGERVGDVVAFGGNAIVDGEVIGDVVAFGGSATVRGHVTGDVAAFGGNTEVAGTVDGEISTFGGTTRGTVIPAASPHTDTLEHLSELGSVATLGGLAAFVHAILAGAANFLFVLLVGLLLLGTAPDRFDALRVVTAREPLHVTLLGVASFLGAVLAMILLAITILGIPAAIAVGIAMSLASYVGLAAVGAVIGAVLPVERLRDRPVAQLAAGVGALYLASLVPGIGTLAVLIASAAGLGAVVRTRLGREVPPRLPVSSPYRSSSYPEGA